MTRNDIIKHYGSILKAVEATGYSRAAMYKWRLGIPLRSQLVIESHTNGALKAQKRLLQKRK